jgi:hypothetical protein
MKSEAPPTISSFVIRFVVADASANNGVHPVYHGSIRHIQSADELNFRAWGEAVEFMRRFVPLEKNDCYETKSST